MVFDLMLVAAGGCARAAAPDWRDGDPVGAVLVCLVVVLRNFPSPCLLLVLCCCVVLLFCLVSFLSFYFISFFVLKQRTCVVVNGRMGREASRTPFNVLRA